ncbi:lytic murein transglycosylase [uncultured Roseovarius sp.]|uniref:lytic murein transglycosylase n=1 Tax=uncultured Roseovarius sp. TaxID=293344 RepID=UPI002638CD19|nr:lytic murein transglycosylase [uncultured Roseovarius sp.]
MRITALLAAVTGTSIGISALAAAPVETSLRPHVRPGTMTTDAVVISIDIPVRSLRPVARPAVQTGGDEVEVIKVATSNPAFEKWIRGFRGRALNAGISSKTFERAFRGVAYNPDVVKKDRNQAEFKRHIWDYLDSAASPPRVEGGQKALRKHKRALTRIEQAYGVEKEVVTAVWGLESYYGTRKGDTPLIGALATLAFDGRRGAFFEKQLIAALKIIQSGDVAPKNMTGSWAGAMGHTQFIPTSYLAYAVDFTGDGKRDIWSDDPTDALASTAAYLKRFGWRKGMPWGVEVRVPRGVSPGSAKRMPSDWAARGVVGADGKPVRDFGSARILQPAGPNGASFMVFANFDVIKRYNNADAYAIGVGHLSDRIGGGPEIRASWPRGYDPLTFDERMEVQRLLKRKGYKLEKIDGIIGPNSAKAIRHFQQSVGVKPDGFPSKSVLKLLKTR